MSTPIAFALIIANDFSAMIAYLYTSSLVVGISTEIATGVTRGGIPIPAMWRRKMIEKWLYIVVGGMAACAIAATLNVAIATAATDRGVKTVAYMGAFIGAMVVVGWSLAAALDFSYFRSALRQAKGD